jgi:hypothetical protein
MRISAAILVFSLVSVTPALVMGTPIAQWTFETSQPTSAGPFAPEVGSGSASAVGLGTISSPAGNGSAHSFSGNGWNVGDYFQFQLSTIGYQNILLSLDQTSSSTGPGAFGLLWSTDGSTFSQLGIVGADYTVLVNGSPNTAWSSSGSPNLAFRFNYNLSSITALNNASTVYFQMVDMASTNPTNGAVGTSGTDRIDNFTVTGDQIPANVPDSIPSLAGLGCVFGLLAVLRRISNAANPSPQGPCMNQMVTPGHASS